MDIKEGSEINIGWNSIDCRALDTKIIIIHNFKKPQLNQC